MREPCICPPFSSVAPLPSIGASRRYDRPTAAVDALQDTTQVLVDLGGSTTYTTTAGGGPARPLSAGASGRGAAAAAGVVGGAQGGATGGQPPKVQPPWLAAGSLGVSGRGSCYYSFSALVVTRCCTLDLISTLCGLTTHVCRAFSNGVLSTYETQVL
jgi:hypothetical protein